MEIYGRYLRNEAQSEAAKAIRAGRVIPWSVYVLQVATDMAGAAAPFRLL